MQVNIFEAKSQLSQLIKSARAGEDVVIANRGEPVARLVAIDVTADRSARFADKPDFLRWLSNNPLPARAQRGSAEIDASIAQERDAWS